MGYMVLWRNSVFELHMLRKRSWCRAVGISKAFKVVDVLLGFETSSKDPVTFWSCRTCVTGFIVTLCLVVPRR